MTDKPKNAEQLLKALADADNAVATATGVLKAKKEDYERAADAVFAYMDEQQTETIRSSKIGLQVTIGETDNEHIEDYEVFSQFVIRHKALHLVQRRIAPAALREWNENNPRKQVPGIGVFTKRRLHVTKVTK